MSLPLQTTSDEPEEKRRKEVEELRRRYLAGTLEDEDLIPEDADVTALVEELRKVDPPTSGPH